MRRPLNKNFLRDIGNGDTGDIPLIITQKGKAKAVVQDIESYEQTQETCEMGPKWGRTTVNVRQIRMYAKKRTVLEA